MKDLNKDFWSKHERLLLGKFFTKISRTKDLTYYRSVFTQRQYNLIMPKVKSSKFDWTYAEHLIRHEKSRGHELSYYVMDNLNQGYTNELKKRGLTENGNDIYVANYIENKYELKSGIEFIFVNNSNYDEFSNVVEECFVDYDNNQEYCEFCIRQSRKNPENFINTILKIDNRIACFGSLLISKDLNAGFLHNMGTLEGYRRKGLFSELTKYLANYAFDHGVNKIHANVDEDGASHKGFLKMGFENVCKYHIYN